MSQDLIKLPAEARKQGKHYSRQLRSQRRIPAVIYGPKVNNLTISISQGDAERYAAHKFENTIFSLESSDKDLRGLRVLRKDMSRHPVTKIPTHIDFYAPDMTQTVRVWVEINFVGKPAGLMEGGVFNAVNRDIEVECLPTEIPESIEADVSHLNVDDNLHVSDLVIPDNIKVISSEKLTLATVAVVKEEAPAPAEGEVAAAEGAEGAAGAEAAKPEAAGEKKDKE